MSCGKAQRRLLPGCRPWLIKPAASPGWVTWGFWDTAGSSWQPLSSEGQPGCSAPSPGHCAGLALPVCSCSSEEVPNKQNHGIIPGWFLKAHPTPPLSTSRSPRLLQAPCKLEIHTRVLGALGTPAWVRYLSYSGERKKLIPANLHPSDAPCSNSWLEELELLLQGDKRMLLSSWKASTILNLYYNVNQTMKNPLIFPLLLKLLPSACIRDVQQQLPIFFFF